MTPPAVGANAVLKPTNAITTSAEPVIRIVFSRLKSNSSPSSPTSRKPTAIVIVKTSSAAISTQRLLTVNPNPCARPRILPRRPGSCQEAPGRQSTPDFGHAIEAARSSFVREWLRALHSFRPSDGTYFESGGFLKALAGLVEVQ